MHAIVRTAESAIFSVFLHCIEYAPFTLQQYGGWNKQYQHRSDTLGCDMKFSVFTPPASETKKVPVSCVVALLAQLTIRALKSGPAITGSLLLEWVNL